MPKQKKRRKIWKRYKGLLYYTKVWTPPPVVSLMKIWVLDGNLFWGLWTHYWYKGPIQMVHEPRILYLVSAFPFFLMPFLSIFPQPPPQPGQGSISLMSSSHQWKWVDLTNKKEKSEVGFHSTFSNLDLLSCLFPNPVIIIIIIIIFLISISIGQRCKSWSLLWTLRSTMTHDIS